MRSDDLIGHSPGKGRRNKMIDETLAARLSWMVDNVTATVVEPEQLDAMKIADDISDLFRKLKSTEGMKLAGLLIWAIEDLKRGA
jgi:hypothetical protein